jgi:glycosyltransferase involved in cell wall biosynthesis
MACGAPVVASSLAVSALAVQPGEDLLVADDPAAFTGHILRIIETPSLRARLSKAGRAYVEAHHDWGVIVTSLENIYRSLGQNRSVQPASSVANDEHV